MVNHSIGIISAAHLLVLIYITTFYHDVTQARIPMKPAQTLDENEVEKMERFRRETEDSSNASTSLTATDALSMQDQDSCMADLSSIIKGRDGRDGRDGRGGEKGLKGEAGNSGLKGDGGEKGEPGSPGVDATYPGKVGTSYIRWGRSTCPSTSKLIYEGIVGGGYYSHKGGAANYLCMPFDPEHLTVEAGAGGTRDLIYTTEYQIDSFSRFAHLHNHDAPCALCLVSNRGTMIMIPAKTTCPSDWTVEYKGYLMSAHYNHDHQSEYLCVDENAEARPGSHAGTNGAFLYLVQATCGTHGLPCIPYDAGNELACVICTI